MLFLEMFNFYLATVLLPKKEVNSLNVLSLEEREQFLSDMSVLGDAIIQSCTPIRGPERLRGICIDKK